MLSLCLQTKLIASLIKEIADEANQEGIRQMACIVCKNLIQQRQVVSIPGKGCFANQQSKVLNDFLFLQDQRYQDLWLNLEPLFKNNVKEAIMSSLATESSMVRSQIASLIAAIA
jgi:hypothetical protein